TEDGEEAEEILRLPPSRWYLTGFLAPARGRELEASDGSDDEELPAGHDEDDEDAGAADPEPKRKNILPASLGLSVLLPPGSADDTVRATLTYAEYTAENEPVDRRPAPRRPQPGGADLLPHRRRQDRSLPRGDRVLPGAAPSARS
ncbi:MAG: hypothetical protein GY856_10880, partial [bacterium]|nr:hypothetical protein [bacterium]